MRETIKELLRRLGKAKRNEAMRIWLRLQANQRRN